MTSHRHPDIETACCVRQAGSADRPSSQTARVGARYNLQVAGTGGCLM